MRRKIRSDLGPDFRSEIQDVTSISIWDSIITPIEDSNLDYVPDPRHNYDSRPQLLIWEKTLKSISRPNFRHRFQTQIWTLTQDSKFKSHYYLNLRYDYDPNLRFRFIFRDRIFKSVSKPNSDTESNSNLNTNLRLEIQITTPIQDPTHNQNQTLS